MDYKATQKEMIVVIKADGTVEITTKGIKGPECKPELEKLSEHISKVESIERTSEWYETNATSIGKVYLDGSVK